MKAMEEQNRCNIGEYLCDLGWGEGFLNEPNSQTFQKYKGFCFIKGDTDKFHRGPIIGRRYLQHLK